MIKTRQQAIADALVANNIAHRMPLKRVRCWDTIELQRNHDKLTRIYVKRDGTVWEGYTLGTAERVQCPQLLQRWIGDAA